jgi:hypothetical protein
MINGDDGQPLPLFHGSYHAIRQFRPLRGHDMAGIYFTPKFEDAVSLAHDNCVDEDDRPTVMVAHLDIRNPFVMHGIESQVISESQRDELISLGYDGVIGMSKGVPYEYVAFDPAQVAVIAVDHNPEPPELQVEPTTFRV